MANKMLIDATHPEETRVVVLRGNRVEEFDFESASRRQLRGNIYLAKVTRVEPSLQAAFVDYGGNRHGFLAFSEIHPDYYQIPVADRQALIAEDERAHRAAEDEHENRSSGRSRRRGRNAARRSHAVRSEPLAEHAEPEETGNGESQATGASLDEIAAGVPSNEETDTAEGVAHADEGTDAHPEPSETAAGADTHLSAHDEALDESAPESDEAAPAGEETAEPADASSDHEDDGEAHAAHAEDDGEDGDSDDDEDDDNGEDSEAPEEEAVESVGGADALEEVPDRAPRYRRQYKIQEVIKRRQIMLVQVVKEERGSKGAALTTYLSLAGRYSVLMPNTARGGGISRKITNSQDRARLKEAASMLEVPEGMGVILRTAGASRTPSEIKRDFEYLLRVWENVRDLTLKSTAPTLVYEEGSLVKRSIRDLYGKDIDEIIVAGDQAYAEAKEFMKMLMPGHSKNIRHYHDGQPIFTRYGIESQLDAMFSPTVQLRSGGYIVINQTEALVAIDVNSGRATREHHIEDTALKTNLEAADEVARQLRLRDLAGLVVIDFIDMDENRNNRAVERRLKDALKNDRARIQVGRISHFGLMEMSRQRIRTGVLESSTEKCPHCGGTGHLRSVSSLALQLLRGIEEVLLRGATHNLTVHTGNDVAIYILNHKRAHLTDLEQRFRVSISVAADRDMDAEHPFLIEKGEQVHSPEEAKQLLNQMANAEPLLAIEEDPDDVAPLAEEEPAGDAAEGRDEGEAIAAEGEDGSEEAREGGRRRRRRRRGGRGHGERENGEHEHAAQAEGDTGDAEAPAGEQEAGEADGDAEQQAREGNGEGSSRRRRRGRRGGRRNRRDRDEHHAGSADGEAEAGSEEDTHGHDDPGYNPDAPEVTYHASQDHISAEPPAPPAEAPAASEPSAPAPRRRSTVREPAPVVAFGDTGASTAAVAEARPPAAAPSPSAEHDAAPKPRRTGWWGRRLLGGDKS